MTPLDGIVVLDLSQQLPGPYATLLLAELGARVIKIEPPQGDMARVLDPPMFRRVNAGKESVVLDLKAGTDRAELLRLAARSDVLVEGFRPGTVNRLGADYASVARVRPDIVYCSLSGFGQDGPYRDVPGHDVNYLGVAGGVEARSADGAEEIGMPVIDLAAATNAALAIVAAVAQRARTGEGAYLDVAMLDAAVAWAGVKVPERQAGHGEPTYTVLAAADGRRLSLGVLEDKFWVALCRALTWDDWLDDPELATHAGRRARAVEVHARLARTIAGRPRDAWMRTLWEHDVPAAPVHERDEVAEDPQVRHRRLVDGAQVCVPLAPSLRGPSGRAAPALGEHSAHVLGRLEDAGTGA